MYAFIFLALVPDPGLVELLERIAGPLLGAGAGSYFGLKSAINGMRETTRDTLKELQQHRRDSIAYVGRVEAAIAALDRQHGGGE